MPDAAPPQQQQQQQEEKHQPQQTDPQQQEQQVQQQQQHDGQQLPRSSGGGQQPRRQQMAITLDSCREQFFVTSRATQRFGQQLGKFSEDLAAAKADDAWLSDVQAEAQRLVLFHQQQHEQWAAISADIDAYVDSVRSLAEQMAVQELKGETSEEAELAENRAKKVHPELVKFQLEKKARILGKIGGVPALPGMGAGPPTMPRGTILKATASPAAREIYYSKVEDKDAAQLAGVFQFRKAAASDAAPVDWQQEAKAKNVRRHTEAISAELQREEEQNEQLRAGGAAELANALAMRQRALRSKEEEDASTAASAYRRVSASGNTANAPMPVRELQDATPELADKLRKRQEDAAKAQRLSEEEAAASSDQAPAWGNTAAPFGGELSAVLLKRHKSDEREAAARPVKSDRASLPTTPVGAAASDELAARLRQRQARLESQQAQGK